MQMIDVESEFQVNESGPFQHISKIIVDPRDSNVVYVAAQGPLWSGGGDRGLYKTTDGGETWGLTLSSGEYTGVTDIAMDPRNPDVIYAATHQRMRNVAALVDGKVRSRDLRRRGSGTRHYSFSL